MFREPGDDHGVNQSFFASPHGCQLVRFRDCLIMIAQIYCIECYA